MSESPELVMDEGCLRGPLPAASELGAGEAGEVISSGGNRDEKEK